MATRPPATLRGIAALAPLGSHSETTLAQTLDDMLRAVAAAGNFSHLSIVSSPINGFVASFAPATNWGYGHGTADDPVTAAVRAIENAPKAAKAPKNKQVHPPAPKVPTRDMPVAPRQPGEFPEAQANEPTPNLMGLFTPVTEEE